MANIEENVEKLINKPIVDLGYKIYDVQYVKEGQQYFLRVFIQKDSGEIDLEDCEKVSNEINPILDEVAYIKEQYFLEVSSTGIEKILRKNSHLEENIGNKVELKLFKPISLSEPEETKGKKKKKNTTKEVIGILQSFNKDNICILVEEKEMSFTRKDIAQIKTVFDWENIEKE